MALPCTLRRSPASSPSQRYPGVSFSSRRPAARKRRPAVRAVTRHRARPAERQPDREAERPRPPPRVARRAPPHPGRAARRARPRRRAPPRRRPGCARPAPRSARPAAPIPMDAERRSTAGGATRRTFAIRAASNASFPERRARSSATRAVSSKTIAAQRSIAAHVVAEPVVHRESTDPRFQLRSLHRRDVRVAGLPMRHGERRVRESAELRGLPKPELVRRAVARLRDLQQEDVRTARFDVRHRERRLRRRFELRQLSRRQPMRDGRLSAGARRRDAVSNLGRDVRNSEGRLRRDRPMRPLQYGIDLRRGNVLRSEDTAASLHGDRLWRRPRTVAAATSHARTPATADRSVGMPCVAHLQTP